MQSCPAMPDSAISIPHGTIKRKRRGKGTWAFPIISIPHGTIKSDFDMKKVDDANISIPHGTIKREKVKLYQGGKYDFNTSWYN